MFIFQTKKQSIEILSYINETRRVRRASSNAHSYHTLTRPRAVVVLYEKQPAHSAYLTRKIFYLQCRIGGIGGIKSG